VVVDNRPGAAGIIGYEVLARAAPDGYTFGYMTFAFITNPSLFSKLPYDSVRDFQPVIFQSSATWLLTVTPSLPIRSVKDLTEHARANPGTLSYGSAGMGGGQHLVMELFKAQTGTNIVHVAYKGVQQAISDVISGEIHIVCDNIASIFPHVQSGRLRGLGVTTLKRSPVVPELPTIAEAGIPGYEAAFTPGYIVPARMPHEIVMRLNAEINKALQSPTIAEKFRANGATIVGGTPEQFAEHIRSETAKWSKVIRAAGITPQ
jgi:tripartite-type tricarboxylate transporter receptor subunit TctC